MAEEISIDASLSKTEKYKLLLHQLSALAEGEEDVIANLANITATLKETFDFLWIGFYLVKKSNSASELVLGPFQGPVACSRIGFGKGVCGLAWQRKEIIIVDDVDKFPGHIACSSLSRSEIVLPFFKNNEVAGVLDADSRQLNNFDATDAEYLQQVIRLVEKII